MRRARVVAAAAVGLLAFTGLARGDQPTTRPDDIIRGNELYQRHCVQCHGALNDGQGPAAAALVVPVPDLQRKFTVDDVDALVPVVLDGRGTMPSFVNSFDKYDARRVLRHMSALDPETARHFTTPAPGSDGAETPNDDAPPDGPDENGPDENGPEGNAPGE